MKAVQDWFKRHFDDPQVVGLVLVLLVGVAIISLFGQMLAPVVAALVIAYLLEGMVRLLERQNVPRLVAVTAVFLLFIAFLLVFSLVLIPELSGQLAKLVDQLPEMVEKGRDALLRLPQQYPGAISEEQVRSLMALTGEESSRYGRHILASFSVKSLVVVFTALIYLVLVPFMVFFFLKDKRQLLRWLAQFLPRHRGLTDTVWREVDAQIGNYVRGKFLEILLVWGASYDPFLFLEGFVQLIACD
jgi:putative permease